MPLKIKVRRRIAKPYEPKPSMLPPKEPDKYCNARSGVDRYCTRRAGFRTVHPGQGRCYKHERAIAQKSLKHGWTSKITHSRVREILVDLSTIEMNVMDLIPEANLLRALTIDFVNRYDEFVSALMAWYADPDNKMRPRRVMDIQDASQLVESISRVVQRMHQIQSEGAISLDTFRRVTEHMGIIVARHVKNPATLNQIEQEWMELALDAKAPPQASDTDSGSEE